MPQVTPSQIGLAIDSLFGTGGNEQDAGRIKFEHRDNVRTILWLLDELPRELLTLPFREYTNYLQSRAALTSAVAQWDAGGHTYAQNAGGSDPIIRIRRLLAKCPDEFPPSYPDFAFVEDDDVRATIIDDARAAWVNFQAREWKGTAVFAGAAIEALLLWALKERASSGTEKQRLVQLDLGKFINEAKGASLIKDRTAAQCRQAKDSRNLIHPGRVAQDGPCDRGSALAALCALDWVTEDLCEGNKSVAAG